MLSTACQYMEEPPHVLWWDMSVQQGWRSSSSSSNSSCCFTLQCLWQSLHVSCSGLAGTCPGDAQRQAISGGSCGTLLQQAREVQ